MLTYVTFDRTLKNLMGRHDASCCGIGIWKSLCWGAGRVYERGILRGSFWENDCFLILDILFEERSLRLVRSLSNRGCVTVMHVSSWS